MTVPPVAPRHTALRRFWHVAGGLALLLPFATGLVPRDAYALALAGVLALLLALDVIRLRAPPVNALFTRALRGLLLPRDLCGLNGTTYFVAGILLAVVLLPPPIAVAGALFLVLGDFAAGVVGRRWGRRRSRPEGKSLEGTLACFLVCLAAALPFAPWPAATAGAAVAAAIEHLRLPLDDNLLIPPLGGAVLLWLS